MRPNPLDWKLFHSVSQQWKIQVRIALLSFPFPADPSSISLWIQRDLLSWAAHSSQVFLFWSFLPGIISRVLALATCQVRVFKSRFSPEGISTFAFLRFKVRILASFWSAEILKASQLSSIYQWRLLDHRKRLITQTKVTFHGFFHNPWPSPLDRTWETHIAIKDISKITCMWLLMISAMNGC